METEKPRRKWNAFPAVSLRDRQSRSWMRSRWRLCRLTDAANTTHVGRHAHMPPQRATRILAQDTEASGDASLRATSYLFQSVGRHAHMPPRRATRIHAQDTEASGDASLRRVRVVPLDAGHFPVFRRNPPILSLPDLFGQSVPLDAGHFFVIRNTCHTCEGQFPCLPASGGNDRFGRFLILRCSSQTCDGQIAPARGRPHP